MSKKLLFVVSILLIVSLITPISFNQNSEGFNFLTLSETQAKKKKKKTKVRQTLFWDVYTDKYGKRRIKMSAVIKNTGKTNVRLSNGTGYFFDNNGNLFANTSGNNIEPSILAPGQEGYSSGVAYLSGGEDFTRDANFNKSSIGRVEYEFTYKKTKEKPKSRLQVLNSSWRIDSNSDVDRYVVSGTLRNNTKKTIKFFNILALFYDSQGNLLYVGDADPAFYYITRKSNMSFDNGFSDFEMGVNQISSHRVIGYATY